MKMKRDITGMANLKNLIDNDPYDILNTLELFSKSFSEFELEHQQNQIKFIVKKLILIRIIINENDIQNKWFLEGVYSDLLSLLETLSLKKERYFRFNLRSLIENTLRVLLLKKDNDNTGVINLFKEAKLTTFVNSVNNLHSIYVSSNNFVHNNIQSKLPIGRSYYDLKYSKLSKTEISYMLRDVEAICRILNKIIIFRFSNEIDCTFHRKKKSLRRLIGENNYCKYFNSESL